MLIDTYWREEEEGELALALALVKLGYGEPHIHRPCRAHCWGYTVSTPPHSRVASAMETFKQDE